MEVKLGSRVPNVNVCDLQATSSDETAILLVHGFGGGAFAWRNIMQPLSDAAGCRVLAFDRPAFGGSLPMPAAAILSKSRGTQCTCGILCGQLCFRLSSHILVRCH